MIRGIGIRPIIFSVNCYIATILTMFVAFSLDLKSPGWAMTTVYLTSQPLSGAMRAKAFFRAIGTFIGAAAMVAIVPNLVDAPELTTLAIPALRTAEPPRRLCEFGNREIRAEAGLP